METFELSNELIEKVSQLISKRKNSEIKKIVDGFHYADLAEIIDELDESQRIYLIKLIDSDKTSDVLTELDEDIQRQVIDAIEDEEHARDIIEMLRYDEDSAGGLMAKELVRVRETWTVDGCVRKMRAQAQNVTRVHSVYVVDKNDHLIGRLSLKDLLT